MLKVGETFTGFYHSFESKLNTQLIELWNSPVNEDDARIPECEVHPLNPIPVKTRNTL